MPDAIHDPPESTEELEVSTVQCSRCDEHVKEGDTISVGGREWCEGCSNDHSFVCNHCGCREDNDERHEVDGESWCQQCRDDHATTCECCDDLTETCETRTTHNDSRICESCYDSSYFTCDSCGNIFHNDDYDGDGLCNGCGSERRDEEMGPIQDYDASAPCRKHGEGPHYFGVELEVECDNDIPLGEKAEQCISRFPDGAVMAKDDGSLSHGFEIVTAPASLSVQRTWWDKFFAAVPRGLKSFDTCTCGLHVHCSRSPLTELQIAKVVCFTNAAANRKFIETIAARSNERYAKIFPKKLSSCRFSASRYEAVNLDNCATIEFRIFKGTLKKESFYKALEFCDALISFCAPASRSLSESMELGNFINHVATYKKLWPHLHAFIQGAWLGIKTTEVTDLGFRVIKRATFNTDSD